MADLQEVYVVSGCRTAVGSFGGSLRDVPAADLGAAVVREAVARAGVPAETVDDVVMGCVGQVAEDAYLARVASLRAGLPASSNAMTVNRLCSSGLQAILSGVQAIRCGDAGVVVAGGAENLSRLPFYVRRARWGLRLGHERLEDAVLTALTDPFGNGHMGETGDAVARKYGISRAEQDEFAMVSQQRAAAAIDAGRFRDQIVPLDVPEGRRGTRRFDTDEHPRRETSLEKLARLQPAFGPEGSVTAGNSSGINDGAAALVLVGAETLLRLGLQPRLRYVAGAMAGVDPLYMGYAPALAIPKALGRAGLPLSAIDVVELNEAFAAQAVAVIRDTGLDPARTNPNGGAIALGHPLGATAAILTVKAMHELERTGGRYAMVTMCVGGGQGLAAIFERVAA